jgi:hypothetical protein
MWLVLFIEIVRFGIDARVPALQAPPFVRTIPALPCNNQRGDNSCSNGQQIVGVVGRDVRMVSCSRARPKSRFEGERREQKKSRSLRHRQVHTMRMRGYLHKRFSVMPAGDSRATR